MVEKSTGKPSDGGPAPGADAGDPAGASFVNQQILDSLAALAGSDGNAAPLYGAAMVTLASAQAAALGMYNAVARQQADAAITSAAVAAVCARMIEPGSLPMPAGEAHPGLVAAAEAQAFAGIRILAALAAQPGDPAGAAAALERVAAAAAASPGAGSESPSPGAAKSRRPRSAGPSKAKA